MTLSLSVGSADRSLSVGSAIWSIFWESGIQSNATSAWLGSIHEVLLPLLESADILLLAKVFAIRNAKLAPLWLGFLTCGSSQVLEMIQCYLTTHQEHLQYSCGHPDPNVAIWTGSKQSFLDEECSGAYEDPNSLISAADVLRHRFNFRLAVQDAFFFGWPPPGFLRKEALERELWPRLESPSPSRRYEYWVWWLTRDKKVVEKGFSHDRRAHAHRNSSSDLAVDSTRADHLPLPAMVVSLSDVVSVGIVKQKLSRKATIRALQMGSWEASGDRTLDSMGIEVRKHKWLKDERGL